MKAILCGSCGDFRALAPTGTVSCRCGNVTGWWVDSMRGIMKVFAKDRDTARAIGIHNTFLEHTFEKQPYALDFTHQHWKEITEEICNSAKGYIFHESLRNCPVAILGIGITSDISWELNECDVPKEGGAQ